MNSLLIFFALLAVSVIAEEHQKEHHKEHHNYKDLSVILACSSTDVCSIAEPFDRIAYFNCLYQNQEKLSETCSEKFQATEFWNCGEDVQTLCPKTGEEMQSGEDIKACMKKQMDKVSEPCRAAIAAMHEKREHDRKEPICADDLKTLCPTEAKELHQFMDRKGHKGHDGQGHDGHKRHERDHDEHDGRDDMDHHDRDHHRSGHDDDDDDHHHRRQPRTVPALVCLTNNVDDVSEKCSEKLAFTTVFACRDIFQASGCEQKEDLEEIGDCLMDYEDDFSSECRESIEGIKDKLHDGMELEEILGWEAELLIPRPDEKRSHHGRHHWRGSFWCGATSMLMLMCVICCCKRCCRKCKERRARHQANVEQLAVNNATAPPMVVNSNGQGYVAVALQPVDSSSPGLV